MIQSQILKSIETLINNNKDREVSFHKWTYLLWKDKMTWINRDIVESRYLGFDSILGMYMYTWLENNNEGTIYNFIRKHIKRNFYALKIFPYLCEGVIIETIFKIQNRREFLSSFFEFIDNEKKSLHIKDKGSSQKHILDLVKSSKEKLGITKFPLSFTIKDYLSEPVLFYEQILSLEDTYKIENIQIFQWNIVFTLSQISEEKIAVEYKKGVIIINNKPIKFKKVEWWNKTEDIFYLTFQYFQEHQVNSVTYFELEEYLDTQNHFKTLKKLKFTDEWIRWYLSWKNTGIKKDFWIPNFLTNNVSSIQCEYYVPLKT